MREKEKESIREKGREGGVRRLKKKGGMKKK